MKSAMHSAVILGSVLLAAAAPIDNEKRQYGSVSSAPAALPSIDAGNTPSYSLPAAGEGSLPSGIVPPAGAIPTGSSNGGIPDLGSGGLPTGFPSEGGLGGSLPSGLPSLPSGPLDGLGSGSLPTDLPSGGDLGSGLPSGPLPLPSGLPDGLGSSSGSSFPGLGDSPSGSESSGSPFGDLGDLGDLGDVLGGLGDSGLGAEEDDASAYTKRSLSGLSDLGSGSSGLGDLSDLGSGSSGLSGLSGLGSGSSGLGDLSDLGSGSSGLGDLSDLGSGSSGLGGLSGLGEGSSSSGLGDLLSGLGGSGSGDLSGLGDLGSLGGSGSSGLGDLGDLGGLGSLGGSDSSPSTSSPSSSSSSAPSTGSSGSSNSSSGSSSGSGYADAPASSYSGGSSASDVSDDTGCRAMTFIFARGTGEIGDMGTVVGPPTAQALQDLLGANGVSVQGVDYPADAAGNANLGASGGPEMAKLAQQALSACPDTKLVLSGYSQGAMVVHNALGDIDGSQVAAVLAFGDPFNGQAFDGVDDSKVLEVCGSSDFLCSSGGTNVSGGHISYSDDGAKAAEFAVQAAGL